MSFAHRLRTARWLTVCCAVLLALTLAPPAAVPARAEPGDVPKVTAGRGPQQRPVPPNAAPDTTVDAAKRPPVVPLGVRSGGVPVRVGKAELARVTRAAPGEAFVDLLLRPGFVLGDTSLVTYFNLRDESFDSWRVDLFDADSGTRQESVSLGRDQLATSVCRTPRTFCKSLGGAEGWRLDPAKSYFITITAIYPDGEVTSAASEKAQPRATIDPPPISNGQAAGCGCGSALGVTDASQAVRAIGVNTGTGAFSRTEEDAEMASFGVPFASVRTYSSANPSPGVFGPGWAWVYDMRVTATGDGATVRADDGAEARYRLDGGAYVRPAGVRSNLRRAGEGWELVTFDNIVYAFDAPGRLVSIRNPRQVGVRLAYGASGLTVTDASGHVATVRTAGGLIESITLPDRRKVFYSYTNGLLTKVRDARGENWRYRYDAAGRLTQVIDPRLNATLTNEYGPDGRVARQLDALGAATRFEWDAGKQEAKTTDADAVVVWDGYRGNVLIYSQRGNGDTNNHRYDGTLSRNLVVNGNQNQHESRYDPAGNLVEQFAPQRRFSEKTTYDARNNPTSHVDGDGNKWTDEYNGFDELVVSTDAEGHKLRYAYDARGLLTEATDQRGKVTRYEYVAAGRPNAGLLTAITSPAGRRTEFGYDRTGRQISVTDPRGTLPGAKPREYTTRYVFDEQDRPVATFDPGKHEPWRSDYDDVGRLERSLTPSGVRTTYRYFANGLLKVAADERRTTLFTYTPAGRRESARVDMRHEPDLITSYTYNAKGLLHSVTDPRGNVPDANKADFTTTYVYDANDNPIQIRRPYPGGQVVTRDITPDDLDRTVEKKDELGAVSKYDRGNDGQVRGVTDNLGRTTSMSYDRNGRQTGITDPTGGQARTEYDAAGNMIKQVSATGGVTTYEYDDDGLPIATTEPRGNVDGADKERFTTHTEYDAAGNAVRTIDALDNVTGYAYDQNNRAVAVTDAKGRITRYTYDADDRTRSVTAPDSRFGESTVYAYHSDGLLASVTDPKGHQSTLDYDEAGRLVKSTDPLGRSTFGAYDADGNRTQTITLGRFEAPWQLSDEGRAKRTIVDTYDIAGRREKRTLGSAGPVYAWGYDAKDRTTSYGDPAGVRQVVYDDEDQIRSVTRKEAGRPDETFAYGYDERGNITSRRYPDGTTVTAGYDADSRQTSLTAGGATWTFGYDVAGRRTTTTLPGATGLRERRVYDEAGRLTAIGTERSGDPVPGVRDPVSHFGLTLDEVGNPTRVVTTRGGVSESVAYAYDKADRVTSACYAVASCTGTAKPVGRIDYTYDQVGNRTSQRRTGTAGEDLTRYEYDAADQLTEEAVRGRAFARRTEYAYDVLGNQTRAGGDRFTYNLDRSVATATVSGRTTAFGYDATGLRLTSTSTAENQPATTQRWTWDVAGTLPQIASDTVTDGAGTVLEQRGFTYGPDDEPLALLDPATGVHPYTHDWLGGVANMLSPAGAVEQGYDYDPFGNPRVGDSLAAQKIQAEGPGPQNPMQFTGAYQDSTTGPGNYFLRARNYDPGTGRFATRDPIPTAESATSAYTYASNNPIAYTDPTGMTLDAGPTRTTTASAEGATVDPGPSPEEIAKAQQLQSKSTLDVILEAGGQILMEFLGINDILNCLKGDLVACVSMVIGALPWGKIFKAKKIAEAIFRAGKAVVTFFQELKWARAILQGAEKAAEAAKAAAAAAAKAAAEKAAKAKAAAEAAAKKAAAEAAARAKALAAKAKAATKKAADDAKNVAEDCTHSFVAGTRVLMADGSGKPIEKVEPGDTVAAADPAAGAVENRQVTRGIRTDDDKEFTDVTVTTADGPERITTTENHPFWSGTRKRWVHAGDLRTGELLRTSAGTFVQVGAVRTYRDERRTYDLTVDQEHTYYVLAGDRSLLVHNCDSTKLGNALRRNGEVKPTGVDAQAHHIVPCGCKLAGPAQRILRKHEIKIDSAVNGVWMSRKGHAATFRRKPPNSYYDWLNDEIARADRHGGKQGVLDFLGDTKKTLQQVDEWVRTEAY